MTAPTPRLTPEEARRIDSHCIERSAFPSNESNITRLWMTRRILDLLDERAALVARAEQAERDRDTLAKEVSMARAMFTDKETAYTAKAWMVKRVKELQAATDASGALLRSREQA